MPSWDLMRDKWRSGKHVGDARPAQLVRIRRGSFMHRYDTWAGDDVNVSVPGTRDSKPWQAFWTPHEDWRVLPNVVEVGLDQGFDGNGITTANIQIDNQLYEEDTGAGGVFHRILRGALSPLYGYALPWTPLRQPWGMNDWFGYLNSPAQVEVYQGYGWPITKTFTGLIEDLDLRSLPDTATITARDFGSALTDQHLLGKVKDPKLYAKPTIFADRKYADKEYQEGAAGPHDCSSYRTGHPPRLVADKTGRATGWYSENRGSRDVTEYVQIRVPHGRYESFLLEPGYGEMDAWISVYASSKNIHTEQKKCRVDGVPVDDGWLDFHGGELVPGEYGGHPYVKRYTNMSYKAAEHPFGHELELGDDSIIRVSFRHLREVKEDGATHYRASCKQLRGIRRERKPEAKKNAWILVDDYADVVKCALRWAGFKEWNIENTGARLVATDASGAGLTFGNGDTLMDVIKKVQEITNYCFFIDLPSDTDTSIGVPTFRTPNIVGLGDLGVEQVRDTDLLTGMEVKWQGGFTLPEVIYVMGARISDIKKKGAVVPKGHGLGTMQDKRVRAQYLPPWARRANATKGTSAGILRHFVSPVYTNIKTQKEADVAARYVALNGALQALTGVIEIPGWPGISLDSIVAVVDTATGTNTRLYVASRSSVFHADANETSWKTTLGGSIIDNPDTIQCLSDLFAAIDEPELKGALLIGHAADAGIGTAATASGGVTRVGHRSRPPRRRR